MKKIRIFAMLSVWTLLFSACSSQPETVLFVQPTAYPSAVVTSYFPLAKGATWIHEGNVKWQGESEVHEKTMQWKMEVVGVVQQSDITGFKMRGAPWDLAFYEDGKQPSEYSMIKVGTGRFYTGTVEDLERIADESDILAGLVNEYGLFLEVPLVVGKRFCDPSTITRTDGLYCWLVSSATQAQLADINGIDTASPMTEFMIIQATLPDFSAYTFVPGIDITGYKYTHHGTVSEADIAKMILARIRSHGNVLGFITTNFLRYYI